MSAAVSCSCAVLPLARPPHRARCRDHADVGRHHAIFTFDSPMANVAQTHVTQPGTHRLPRPRPPPRPLLHRVLPQSYLVPRVRRPLSSPWRRSRSCTRSSQAGRASRGSGTPVLLRVHLHSAQISTIQYLVYRYLQYLDTDYYCY